MAKTLANLPVEEIRPPRLTFSRDGGLQGERTFKCEWIHGEEIASALLPSSVATPGGAIVGASAYWPGKRYLLCESCELTALDEDFPDNDDFLGVATSSFAKLTIRYSTLSTGEAQTGDGQDGQVALSLQVSVSGEMLQLGSQFKWASDDTTNNSDEAEIALLLPMISYSVTLHAAPLLPLEVWQSNIGKVNTQVMPVLGNAAIGTVLFTGAQATRTVTNPSPNGTDLWELMLSFDQKLIQTPDGPVGWQHIWRPGPNGKWDEPVLGNGERIYQTADLNRLFFLTAT